MTGRRSRGFTVLEVMLASTLLAVFLAAVFGLVWSTVELRTLIEEKTQPNSIGPVVLDRVVEDLANLHADPYKGREALKAEMESMGGGDVTKVDLITTTNSRARVEVDDEWVASSICEVGYWLRRSETADGLLALYRREDFGVDDKPFEGGKFYKLADRVVSFRIDWFPEDPGKPDSEEADGEEEWDSKELDALPWGCRITLVLMPPVDLDSKGEPVEDVDEITFVRFLAFPHRFDDDS